MQSFLLWHDLDRLSIVWRSSHSWESLIISDWFQLKWSTQLRIAIHFPSDVFLIVTLQGDEILNGKCSLNDYKVKIKSCERSTKVALPARVKIHKNLRQNSKATSKVTLN